MTELKIVTGDLEQVVGPWGTAVGHRNDILSNAKLCFINTNEMDIKETPEI